MTEQTNDYYKIKIDNDKIISFWQEYLKPYNRVVWDKNTWYELTVNYLYYE